MFEGTSCINDPIIISPDLAFRAEATTGEGSIWHPDRNTLFWVDIEGKTLYEYIPDLQNCRSWQFDRMVSTVVPETDSTVVVALQNEIKHQFLILYQLHMLKILLYFVYLYYL